MFLQVILQRVILCVNSLYQWTRNGMDWRERNCWKWWLSGAEHQTSKMVDFKTKMFCSSNNYYVLLGTDWAAYTPLRSTSYTSDREADRFIARLDVPKSCLCSSVDFWIRRRLLSSYYCQVVRFHFPRDLTLDQDLLRVLYVPHKRIRRIVFRNIRCNMSVSCTLTAEFSNFMEDWNKWNLSIIKIWWNHFRSFWKKKIWEPSLDLQTKTGSGE